MGTFFYGIVFFVHTAKYANSLIKMSLREIMSKDGLRTKQSVHTPFQVYKPPNGYPFQHSLDTVPLSIWGPLQLSNKHGIYQGRKIHFNQALSSGTPSARSQCQMTQNDLSLCKAQAKHVFCVLSLSGTNGVTVLESPTKGPFLPSKQADSTNHPGPTARRSRRSRE